MLTVRSTTHPTKTMTFNDTLETFTLCRAYHVNLFSLSENVHCNGLTNIFFD